MHGWHITRQHDISLTGCNMPPTLSNAAQTARLPPLPPSSPPAPLIGPEQTNFSPGFQRGFSAPEGGRSGALLTAGLQATPALIWRDDAGGSGGWRGGTGKWRYLQMREPTRYRTRHGPPDCAESMDEEAVNLPTSPTNPRPAPTPPLCTVVSPSPRPPPFPLRLDEWSFSAESSFR